jgi:hypothetical protein
MVPSVFIRLIRQIRVLFFLKDPILYLNYYLCFVRYSAASTLITPKGQITINNAKRITAKPNNYFILYAFAAFSPNIRACSFSVKVEI